MSSASAKPAPVLRKAARRRPANGKRSVPKPARPYPGHMTDEWFEYLRDTLRRTTPEQFRAELVQFEITDKHGKYTSPYRDR